MVSEDKPGHCVKHCHPHARARNAGLGANSRHLDMPVCCAANKGIGKAAAQLLAQNGLKTIVAARDGEKLIIEKLIINHAPCLPSTRLTDSPMCLPQKAGEQRL